MVTRLLVTTPPRAGPVVTQPSSVGPRPPAPAGAPVATQETYLCFSEKAIRRHRPQESKLTEYPPHWKDIAHATKRRAQYACESCGHPDDHPSGHVLTVHHLDGYKPNCEPSNLIAVCQRCHLSIQARFRPGQLHLPHIEPPSWYRRTQTFHERNQLPGIDDQPW